MSVCRYCGYSIRWVKTTAGKLMPLDPDPTDDGNVVIVHDRAVVLGRDTPMPEESTGYRYMPHHATCPRFPRRGGRDDTPGS